jgi:hypothetical protein
MPLIKSGSRQAISTNIREMMHAGHPQKQAIAAAYRTAREYGKKYGGRAKRADGGGMDTSDFRPSTNVEDDRVKPLWQRAFENTFQMGPPEFGRMLQHPLTPYRQLQELPPAPHAEADATDFGLSNTAAALAILRANPPKSSGPTADELDVRLHQDQSYPLVSNRRGGAIKKYAEGGTDDEDESKAWGALPSPNGVPRITIPAPPVDLGDRPVPKQQGVPQVGPIPAPAAPAQYQPAAPVDLGNQAVPKPGETIQPVNPYPDVADPKRSAQRIADMAGIGDVSRIGEMTPEEQAAFATSAMFMLPMPGEGMAAREAAPAAKAAAKFFDLDPNLVKNFTKVGKQEGSNPGGWYEDLDSGDRYYIKTPPTLEHAKNEKLAAELYKAAGVPTPEIYLTQLNGKPAIASKQIEGNLLPDYHPSEYNNIYDLQSHFPVDAWLANWDVVGLNNDNIIVDKTAGANRIDMGGALRYRAQGALKNPGAFGPEVTELQTMADPNKNASSAAVFGGMPKGKMMESAGRIGAISNEQIGDLVNQYGPSNIGEATKLYNTLVARRDSVVNQILPKENDPTQIAKQIADAVIEKHGWNAQPINQYLKQIEVIYGDNGPAMSNSIFSHLPQQVQRDILGLNTKEALHTLEPWRGPEPGEEWKPDEPGNEWWQSGDNAHAQEDDHFPIPEPPPVKTPNQTILAEMQAKATAKLWGGQQYLDKIAAGTLSKWDAKQAAKSLWENAQTPLHAAAELWHVADEINPHTAEQLYRSLPDAAQQPIGSNIELLKKLTGSSPFDKLPDTEGKYLATHTDTYKAAAPTHYLSDQKLFYKNVMSVLENMEPHVSNGDDFNAAQKQISDNLIELYKKGEDVKPKPPEGGGATGYSQSQKDQFVKNAIEPIPKWSEYEPEHVDPSPEVELPNITHVSNPKEWAKQNNWNLKIPLYKTGISSPKGGYPGELPDPNYKGYEPGWFAADHPEIAKGYSGPLGGTYISKADNPAQLDWRKVSTAGHYTGQTMDRAIRMAKERGHDLLVVHHIRDNGSDSPFYQAETGGPDQSQYIFLNTKGTLRSPKAKFAPEHLHNPWPLAGVMGTAGAGSALYQLDENQNPSRQEGGRIGTMSKADTATQTLRRYGPGGAPSAPGIKPKLNEFSQRFYRSSIGHPPGGGMPGVGNIKTPHVGMIHSSIPGRTDKINMGVKGGSYILPADVVSGVGQGNSMAGSAIINKMFSMGPYGSADKALPTPKVNYGRAAQSSLRMPRLNLRGTPGIMAAGGVHEDNHNTVPIVAAGGETVIPPEVVLRIGHGDMKHGHEILDHMVLHVRKKLIQDLKKLPGPKKR